MSEPISGLGGPSDELDRLETELGDPDVLRCPTCRLEQSTDHDVCARCGADLALLAGFLREARERRTRLYQAVLGGDAVGAMTELGALTHLIGPSPELAVLRRLLRHGVVPIEIAEDLRPTDPLDVFAPAPDLAPLDDDDAPLDLTPHRASAADEAEREAFDALLPTPPPPAAVELSPDATPADATAESAGAEIDADRPTVAWIDRPDPRAPSPLPGWLLPAVVVLGAVLLGVAAGRLTQPPPEAGGGPPDRRRVEWEMAPLPLPTVESPTAMPEAAPVEPEAAEAGPVLGGGLLPPELDGAAPAPEFP